MKGEVVGRSRPKDSLLQEHLEFTRSQKLPPTISQERTTDLEAAIKQRLLDELFDDPVRKALKHSKKHEDEDGNLFIKSKKGLGQLYEDDFQAKLLAHDPNSFLASAAPGTGPEAALKKEIAEDMRQLFYHLDVLNSKHYIPPPSKKEAEIQT